jgi:putative phosphonate metabolism protein
MNPTLQHNWSAQARFAIYYAPARASDWWDIGSAWLGRDAESGAPLVMSEDVPQLSRELADLTRDPRRYGWHGTLVAPFRLADDVTAARLLSMAQRWAHAQKSFEVPVEAATLGDFVALRPATFAADSQIRTIAANALRTFAPLRAAQLATDLARRLAAPLTERQRELLIEWGYPYVLDEFRFHMTLSNSLDFSADRAAIVDWWQDQVERRGPMAIDGAALFVESAPGEPFMLWQRLAFANAQDAGTKHSERA